MNCNSRVVALAEPAGFQNNASGPSATDTKALPKACARGAPRVNLQERPRTGTRIFVDSQRVGTKKSN